MATKPELKEKFATGKKPTGTDFSELIDGVEGPQGPAGAKGAQGIAGKDGAQGPKGETGPAGKDAEPQFTPEEVTALKALVTVE